MLKKTKKKSDGNGEIGQRLPETPSEGCSYLRALLSASLSAFDFLDLAGAQDQHAVLEAAHLTRGRRPQTGGRRLLVPGGPVGQMYEPIKGE